MPPLTPAAVRRQIQTGTPDPVYLLQGEDDVEKSALAADFAELVDEGLRAFNVDRIHAGDWTTGDKLADGVGSLAAAVRTLPTVEETQHFPLPASVRRQIETAAAAGVLSSELEAAYRDDRNGAGHTRQR